MAILSCSLRPLAFSPLPAELQLNTFRLDLLFTFPALLFLPVGYLAATSQKPPVELSQSEALPFQVLIQWEFSAIHNPPTPLPSQSTILLHSGDSQSPLNIIANSGKGPKTHSYQPYIPRPQFSIWRAQSAFLERCIAIFGLRQTFRLRPFKTGLSLSTGVNQRSRPISMRRSNINMMLLIMKKARTAHRRKNGLVDYGLVT